MTISYMLSSRDLITESYNFYRQHIKSLLWFVLIFGVVIFLEAVASSTLIDVSLTNWQGFALSLLLGIPFSLLALLVSVTLILAIHDLSSGKRPNLKNLFSLGAQKFIGVFLASIIVAVISAVGFILLIIPGVYVWVVLAFTLYFIILENQGVREATESSRNLVKGRFGNVLARLFLPNLFWVFTAWLILGIIDGLLGLPQLARLTDNSISWGIGLNLVSSILTATVNAIFMPLFTIVIYLLYKDLKE